MAQAQRDSLQHRQVEIDRVPAGEHVGIELADALAECVERRVLVGAARGLLRHRPLAAVDDQHFIESRRVHRDREQALAFRVGLDVERQHARLDLHVGRRSTGLSKTQVTPCARRRLAFDLAAALDAALDQIAHREAHIRFERVDAGGVQPVAQGRHVGRRFDFDSRDRLASERALVDRLRLRHAQRARALRVGRADIEMRPLPIVAHEERAAVFQPSV